MSTEPNQSTDIEKVITENEDNVEKKRKREESDPENSLTKKKSITSSISGEFV